MAEKLNNRGAQAKQEKLTKFANWPVLSDITKSMLMEKDVWDLVSIRPRPQCKNPRLWAKDVKEDCIVVGIAQQIIRESISDEITFNIIDLEDPKEM